MPGLKHSKETLFKFNCSETLKKKLKLQIQKWRVFIHRFLNFFTKKNHNLWIRNKKKTVLFLCDEHPNKTNQKLIKSFLRFDRVRAVAVSEVVKLFWSCNLRFSAVA